jgi:chromosome partitioning protein
MTAKIISVFNQKGGSGKTTISMHLAGDLGGRGHRVLVVDMDRQATATRWSASAPEDAPFPAKVTNLWSTRENMHKEIKKHLEDFDFIVIDLPPHLDQSSVGALALIMSDMALMPIQATVPDFWATDEAKSLVREAMVKNPDLKVRAVMSRVREGTNLTEMVREVLTEDDVIPLAQSVFRERTAFAECGATGGTVLTVAPRSKAAAEASSLTDEVLTLLVA